MTTIESELAVCNGQLKLIAKSGGDCNPSLGTVLAFNAVPVNTNMFFAHTIRSMSMNRNRNRNLLHTDFSPPWFFANG